MEQDRLPEVGRLYREFANDLAGEDLSRDIQVTSIAQDDQNRIITEYTPTEDPLSSLVVLVKLKRLGTYRGPNRAVSRENVQLVARLGGHAIGELVTVTPELGWPEDFFKPVHTSLLTIHQKMGRAFYSAVKRKEENYSASQLLREAGDVLKGFK